MGIGTGIRTASRLSLIMILLAALGLIDSLYLTAIKLANATAACAGIGNCDAVNSSRYSEIGGVPIALFGAAAYAAVGAMVFLEGRVKEGRQALRLGVFGLTLAGSLYSAYLTYLEVAVLKAICPYCVVSAILMTALFGLSILLLREEDENAVEGGD